MSEMLPPDIGALLGGGGGGGPMPPDIAALMGGGGAPPEEAPAGPAPAEDDPQALYEAALDQTDDPETLIDWALGMARKAAEMEADPEDTLKLEKATTALAQYLADLQKESDGLLQGKATPKAVRKMAPNAGGGY